MTSRIACIILFLISIPAFAAGSLELIVPNIENRQVSMKKTPRLTVIIANVSEYDEPVVFREIGVEKKGSDGKFQNVRVDVQCDYCNEKCNIDPTKLKRGESRIGVWDYRQKDCSTATSGTYRFVVVARYSEAVGGYVYHGVSKEFTLTDYVEHLQRR